MNNFEKVCRNFLTEHQKVKSKEEAILSFQQLFKDLCYCESQRLKSVNVIDEKKECNCLEMFESYMEPSWWICPAHGYKKR